MDFQIHILLPYFETPANEIMLLDTYHQEPPNMNMCEIHEYAQACQTELRTHQSLYKRIRGAIMDSSASTRLKISRRC